MEDKIVARDDESALAERRVCNPEDAGSTPAPRTVCCVLYCPYVAEASVDVLGEPFAVCSLHDCAATRGILDRLLAPAHLWSQHGVPIVITVGALTATGVDPTLLAEEHFRARPAAPSAVVAADCPVLQEAVDAHRPGMVHSAFDPLL